MFIMMMFFGVGSVEKVLGQDCYGCGSTTGCGGANGNNNGNCSFSAGESAEAVGDRSVCIGYKSNSGADESLTFGNLLNTNTSNSANMVIGFGVSPSTQLSNSISNSIMIGVNSTIPSMYFEDAGGAGNLGNVGLGTTAPKTLLHIEADDANGAEEITRFSLEGLDSDINHFQIRNESPDDGELGIMLRARNNTHSDRPVLLIRAVASANSTTSTTSIFQFDSRYNGTGTNARPLFTWTENNNGNNKMIMDANGNVGIGENTPTEILHIDGIGRSTSINWTTTSDERLKENIVSIGNARQILSSLNPVTYDWNDVYSAAHPTPPFTQWGFIAQEVEQVMPEMVVTVVEENMGDSINQMVLTDLKLLNLSPLLPILVKGYQELDNVVSSQNDAIVSMQVQIDSLVAVVSNCCREIEPSFRTTESPSDETGNANFILFQNDPNPFLYSTQIRHHIPSNVTKTEIIIVNMNGRVVKRIPISSRNTDGSITVHSSELKSGTFSYSLLGNGQVLETKKMVCTPK